MKTISCLSVLFISIVVASSCIKDDVFPLSDKNKPTAIRIKNQLESFFVYGDETSSEVIDSAYVLMPDGQDLRQLEIEYISLPSLAKITPSIKSVHDFSSPVSFTISSESNKNVRTLVVNVSYGLSAFQIGYNNLDRWFQTGTFKNGDGYYNVGEAGRSTPWANTNDVAAILDKAACIPSNFPVPTGHVVLQTLMNPTGGKSVGSGIASANLFSGFFRGNPNAFLDRDKQRNNVSFGIPYTYRPSSMTVELKYVPGTQVEKWTPCNSCGTTKWQGVDLSEVDSMDIWVVLHNRIYDEANPSNTKFYRVAAGWLTSSQTYEDWTSITIPIFYGKPDEVFLANNPAAYRSRSLDMPSNPRMVYHHNPVQNSTDPTKWTYETYIIQEQYSANPKNDPITHISISFNSSAGGWEFKGAGTDINRDRVGSKLEIRKVILNK